jgi:hypothetical protein
MKSSRHKTARALTTIAIIVAIVACGSAAERDAKQLVELELVDPASAQYRGVISYRDGTVCGEVNAKNQFGGYVGFKPFTYVNGALITNQVYRPILCSETYNKEELIRTVEPSFTTAKDRAECIKNARTKIVPPANAAELRKAEHQAESGCPPVSYGYR